MKKYLYYIVAVVLMATACVNDDVATQGTSQEQNKEVVIPDGAIPGVLII